MGSEAYCSTEAKSTKTTAKLHGNSMQSHCLQFEYRAHEQLFSRSATQSGGRAILELVSFKGPVTGRLFAAEYTHAHTSDINNRNKLLYSNTAGRKPRFGQSSAAQRTNFAQFARAR